jgi:hypothetical protein
MRIGRVEDVLAVARALHPASHDLGGERPQPTFELFWGEALQPGEILADATDQTPVQQRHALAGVQPARGHVADIAALQHIQRVSLRRRQQLRIGLERREARLLAALRGQPGRPPCQRLQQPRTLR